MKNILEQPTIKDILFFVGLGPSDKAYIFISSINHPNDHIQYYMDHAHDSGIFDDRQYRGKPEAVSNKPQPSAKKLRHHKTLKFFFSWEELKAK